jgi:hypothetical protein
LSAGVGYVNAEFTDHRSGSTGDDLEGRRPPYIPDVTLNLAARYRHKCVFFARTDWLFTGRTFFDESNTDSGGQSSYGIVNARIGYERPDETQKLRWGVYVFGRNLGDAEYYTLKIPTLGIGVPSEPRTVGMMVSAEF